MADLSEEQKAVEVKKLENFLQKELQNRKQPFEWKASDFELGLIIGHGRFGKVYLAREKKSKLLVAIKIINKAAIQKYHMESRLMEEILIHRRLDHPNIITFYDAMYDDRNILLLMPFAENGSLYAFMREQKYKRLSAKLAAKFTYQIALALMYCHELNCIHRDVKPENVLIDVNFNALLADFGWAVFLKKPIVEYCGTNDYMAPEILRNEGHNHSIDLWCLGVMCYEMLTGRSPFCSKHRWVTIEKIVNVDLNFPAIISEDAKDLILRLLQFSPKRRLPLKKVIEHKWITSMVF